MVQTQVQVQLELEQEQEQELEQASSSVADKGFGVERILNSSHQVAAKELASGTALKRQA